MGIKGKAVGGGKLISEMSLHDKSKALGRASKGVIDSRFNCGKDVMKRNLEVSKKRILAAELSGFEQMPDIGFSEITDELVLMAYGLVANSMLISLTTALMKCGISRRDYDKYVELSGKEWLVGEYEKAKKDQQYYTLENVAVDLSKLDGIISDVSLSDYRKEMAIKMTDVRAKHYTALVKLRDKEFRESGNTTNVNVGVQVITGVRVI